jgi:hypothetical protein
VDNAIETRCGVWIARHGEEVNDFLQGGTTLRVSQHTTIQQYLSNHRL